MNIRVASPEENGASPCIVPLSVQSMITQTDKNGKQIKLTTTTYDNDNDSSTNTRSETESPISARLPFFQRLFCCGRRALSSKQYGNSYRADESFGVVSVEKEGVKNKLLALGYVFC